MVPHAAQSRVKAAVTEHVTAGAEGGMLPGAEAEGALQDGGDVHGGRCVWVLDIAMSGYNDNQTCNKTGCLQGAKSAKKKYQKVLKIHGCTNFVNISNKTTTFVSFDMLQ